MTDVEEIPILATVVPEPSDPATPQRRKVYSVPRRFGMGTIFVVTTLFAVLFGILTGVGAPGEFVLILAGFLAIIGFAQMLLFGGKRPRLASVVTGIVLTTLIGLTWMGILISEGRFSGLTDLLVVGLVVCAVSTFIGFTFGLVFGYAGGGVVAGVFLIMDHVERLMYGRRENGEDPKTSNETPPASGVR